MTTMEAEPQSVGTLTTGLDVPWLRLVGSTAQTRTSMLTEIVLEAHRLEDEPGEPIQDLATIRALFQQQ